MGGWVRMMASKLHGTIRVGVIQREHDLEHWPRR
jgi:hypothetical protein